MIDERDEDDALLFRAAVGDVKPLQARATPVQTRKPAPRARFTRADRQAVLKESLDEDPADPAVGGGEELVFQRAGVTALTVRKLRRGHYPVQAEIDLHGLTALQAKDALRAFIAHSRVRQLRCVRVIHGKGLRSGHRGPVLKSAISALLRRMGVVLAYVSARQVDGGTGAIYVLIAAW